MLKGYSLLGGHLKVVESDSSLLILEIKLVVHLLVVLLIIVFAVKVELVGGFGLLQILVVEEGAVGGSFESTRRYLLHRAATGQDVRTSGFEAFCVGVGKLILLVVLVLKVVLLLQSLEIIIIRIAVLLLLLGRALLLGLARPLCCSFSCARGVCPAVEDARLGLPTLAWLGTLLRDLTLTLSASLGRCLALADVLA